MSNDRNLKLARQWYEIMWSQPDLDLADAIIDADYDPDWVHIPKKGPEQVKHEIRYFRSVFPDLRYEIEAAVAQTDQVWIRYRASGTQAGSAWGFPPPNKHVTFSGATILYINEKGLVHDRWGAFSFYDILVDLELVPPLWELNQHLAAD